MNAPPISPRLLKGGIVLIDPQSSAVRRVIALQYNPDTLSRTLQVQAVASDGQDRSGALRIKGPANETIKLRVKQWGQPQLVFAVELKE